MTDPIDQLATRHEADIADAIDAAIDDVIAAFDAVAITAILDNADDDGPSDHERDQLALMLGTDGAEYQPLTDALDASTMTSGLASFFGAIVALAAAQVHHIANTNAGDVVLARDNAVRSLHAAFVTESTIAIRQTTERMLNAIGPANTRAAQISRVIGLSSLQARSLDAMRQQLHTAIATGNKADPETMLIFARGHLSGAQQRMLAKALRDGVTTASAETMLDRHAKALRNARVKAFAGNAAHQIAETAKLTGWQMAQRFGALPTNQRRYWKTAGDERVRLAHSQVPGMNRQGVPLNQPFATPLGPCFTPPLEHGCRCKAVLRINA